MRLITHLFVMKYSYYKVLTGELSKEERQEALEMIENIKERIDGNKILIILPPDKISYKQAAKIATRGIVPTDKDWRGVALFHPENIASLGSRIKVAEKFAALIQASVEKYNIPNVLLITDEMHVGDFVDAISNSTKMKYAGEIFHQRQLSRLGLDFIYRKATVYDTTVRA